MTAISSETVHATCVAVDGDAVLISGRSGSGKSDLALRLIDRGATLVSDDYTLLQRRDGRLLAYAPPAIAGRIEVRGVGIVETAYEDAKPVTLIATLADEVERLPEARTRQLAGIEIAEIAIKPFEASAPIKVELAMARLRTSQ